MDTLRTTTWGEGDRVAVLLHGMMGSSHQFWRIPLTTTAAVEPTTKFTAAGASRAAVDLTAKFTAAQASRTVDALRRTKPAWSDTDRDVEAAAAIQFDVPTAVALEFADNRMQTPVADIPSLVIHADPSRYVSAARAAELQSLGFQVRAIPGADHSIWYSHFDEFLSALDAFVGRTGRSRMRRPVRAPGGAARGLSWAYMSCRYGVRMDVELLAAASVEFERVVGELPEGVWGLPTSCEVDVRELVEHVVEGNRFAAAVLTGVSGREALAAARAQDLDLHQSATQQIEAFRAASADQVVHHPGGDISAEAFLRYRLVDVVVHAWDLLRAANLDETLDTTVTEQLWAVVEPRLTEMLAFGSYGDGPSGKVASDAPAQHRLLDAFGRR
ncbi:hypothetical protein GCM10009745_16300 [Kribbella yunnanensis]|uniref:Mycothiol-dependent maleylpyruvate isomerase metal-binding domain-containing protein n=1 Tax=Kribbella yunnanensis TaxID=190194 RepID=A0ABP4SLZ1_9ACTN